MWSINQEIPEFSYLDTIIDQFLNIKTIKKSEDKKNENVNYYNYLPTSYFFLEELFTKYKFEPTDYFVDIGCGKGRVLIMAMLFGAQNVCGIEVSKEICDELEMNLEKVTRIQQLKKIKHEIINKSILDIEIQKDWNKFFMFKPFNNEISREIIKKIYLAKKNDERNNYLYLYHPDKDVVEWIDENHMFNLVEKDVQVIERNKGYVKKKIRSCIYCNNVTSATNSFWRY